MDTGGIRLSSTQTHDDGWAEPVDQVRFSFVRRRSKAAMNTPTIALTEDGPRAANSSPELLFELLVEYERRCTEAGAPTADSLRPGLDRNLIVAELARVGLAAPAELLVWFEWHDGGEASGSVISPHSALPGFFRAPLDVAIARYQSLVLDKPQEADDDDDEINDWGAGPGWLRLVDDNYGCAIECDPARSAPRLHAANNFFFQSVPPVHHAVSLCTPATWWLQSLDSGAFRWNEGLGRWQIDTEMLPLTQRQSYFY